MAWQVEVQKKETKSLASLLRFPSFLQPPPPRLHPQRSPVTMCVITGAPRDTRARTNTHTHTNTQQAAARQACSHQAKSVIHMPSQPIQHYGVQVSLQMLQS